jgi:hypothetical protein
MSWVPRSRKLFVCCLVTVGLAVPMRSAQAADLAPSNSTVEEQAGSKEQSDQIQERAIKQYPGGGLCGPGEGGLGTRCSCDNYADCQRLAGICGSTCPAGSHHCVCSPQRAGIQQQQLKQQVMPNLGGVIQRRGIEGEQPESK